MGVCVTPPTSRSVTVLGIIYSLTVNERLIIIIIIIYLFSFNKVHVSCMDIYQHRLQCHSFYAIITMLHYLFQYPVERGIPVRQGSLSTVVVGYPLVTVILIITKQK